MALRAFKATFLVAIDEDESDERDESGASQVTLDELAEFLGEALTLELDSETYGDLVGFQSAQINYETLEELPADEVKRLFEQG